MSSGAYVTQFAHLHISLNSHCAEKNTNRVAGGLKATINNPNASEEAKQSASERLENMSSMTGETGKATSGT